MSGLVTSEFATSDQGLIGARSIRDHNARPCAVEANEARVVASATAHIISVVAAATLLATSGCACEDSSALRGGWGPSMQGSCLLLSGRNLHCLLRRNKTIGLRRLGHDDWGGFSGCRL